MEWIETTNKEVIPEEGKTYWVTINFMGGFVAEATYRKGKWYREGNRKPSSDIVAWYPVPKPDKFEIPKPEGMVFPNFKVNKNGNNIKIKAHVLPEAQMRKLGFTDYRKDTWYFCRELKEDISFNISINKENPEDYRIDVLDENFCQPYDYQAMLTRDKNHKFAKEVMKRVEEYMKFFTDAGIIEGHVEGEYI